MSDKSPIEWTDATWNPVTGCDQVSPGCDNCYALNLAPRLKAMGNPSYQTDGTRKTSGPGFGVALHPEMLDKPLHWKRPRRVFVNSMSDLFHPDVPEAFIRDVFTTMALTPRHTYQILTKRPRRMRDLMARGVLRGRDASAVDWPLKNVWLGVSVENQEWADKRIPLLLETPATVRFLSCEPLIGSVDLSAWEWCDMATNQTRLAQTFCRKYQGHDGDCDYRAGRPMVDWVIVGGESGRGARPMHPKWATNIRDQCVAAGVPYFFKQWGSWRPTQISASSPEYIEDPDITLWEDGHQVTEPISGDEWRAIHGEPPDFNHGFASFMTRERGKHFDGYNILDGHTWDEMPELVS